MNAPRSSADPWAPNFFQVADGLAEYRQGHFTRAIALLKGDLIVLGPAPWFILAMAEFRNGQVALARSTFTSALLLFDWSPNQATHSDAWMYHVLRREAERMIEPSTQPGSN